MFWILTTMLLTLGLLCIAAGYRLFCGLAGMRRGASQFNLFWRNLVPGALLALLGAGLVTAETRTLVARRPGIHRRLPSTEETVSPKTPARPRRASSV